MSALCRTPWRSEPIPPPPGNEIRHRGQFLGRGEHGQHLHGRFHPLDAGARLADHAARREVQHAVQPGHLDDHAAVEGHALAVVAGSAAPQGQGRAQAAAMVTTLAPYRGWTGICPEWRSGSAFRIGEYQEQSRDLA